MFCHFLYFISNLIQIIVYTTILVEAYDFVSSFILSFSSDLNFIGSNTQHKMWLCSKQRYKRNEKKNVKYIGLSNLNSNKNQHTPPIQNQKTAKYPGTQKNKQRRSLQYQKDLNKPPLDPLNHCSLNLSTSSFHWCVVV